MEFFQVGRQSSDLFLVLFALNRQHFIQLVFHAVRFASSQVAFPALGAAEFAGSGYAETFGCRFVRLEFVFAFFILFRHVLLLTVTIYQ